MNLIRPHVSLLVAAANAPLQLPVTFFNTVVPRGGVFRLDYILVAYRRTVEVGVQISPDLNFRLLDTRGVSNVEPAAPFFMVTNPAGAQSVKAAQGFRIEYKPGEVIVMEVTGQIAGPLPATVSITYLGQKGVGVR